MSRILVLGGTLEARTFADRAPGDVIYSLAGRTTSPILPDCEIHRGSFGGVGGLSNFLQDNQITALVDGTHPFAAAIAANAERACTALDIPRLKIVRPAWTPGAGDTWIRVASVAEAAQELATYQRAFLAIGVQELGAFSHLDDVWFLVRSVETPAAGIALAHHRHIIGRGPFTFEAERALLDDHRIEIVVCKNSGGAASRAKLAAARELKLPVIMIERPDFPAGETVDDVDAALKWAAL